MAKLYTTDGEVSEINPQNGKSFSLAEMQGLCGGVVQVVSLPSGLNLVCHEEGKLLDLPINYEATEMWKTEYPIAQYPLNNDERIVGNVFTATDEELGVGEEE